MSFINFINGASAASSLRTHQGIDSRGGEISIISKQGTGANNYRAIKFPNNGTFEITYILELYRDDQLKWWKVSGLITV